MNTNHIGISIVAYHTEPQVLSDCLESVSHITFPFTCWVVDNSRSASVEAVVGGLGRRFPPWGHLEYMPSENSGYGGGHNRVLKIILEEGTSRFCLVMNPDVSFERGTIETLVEAMNTDSTIGLLSPRFVFPDGTPQRLCKLLPTPGHLFKRRFLPLLAAEYNHYYQLEDADYGAPFDCPNLSGCFLFLRTDVLRNVGLFDERFFLYFEDVDLVRRIGCKYRTVYWPYATVMHRYRKGSYKDLRLLWNHLVSAVKYFNKWGWWRDSKRSAVNRETLKVLNGQSKVPKEN
ncbi:MAG: glycosyltransferase family 2 protein [Phycisphaerae bacterium]|nr:glycosyltransferase family 2 protein [Phycisphaerae bacterium]